MALGGLLGGLLGGGGGGGGGEGGGGGGGGLGGALFAPIGGAAGFISAIEEKKQKARERRRLRRATKQAEGQTAAEVFSIINSPEVTAQRNFLRSLFGNEAFGGGDQGLQSGTFAGGTEIGGEVFFDTPGKFGLRHSVQRRGKRLGRHIVKGLGSQNKLDAGGTLGRREQARLEKGQQALGELQANDQFRTGAARFIRESGFGLGEADRLSTNPRVSDPLVGGGGGAGGFDPFTANIDRSLQLALGQSGFGTSMSGAFSRALGTGLARTQLQASLLPQLTELSQLGFNLRQQGLPTNLNLAINRSGLPIGFGPSPFAQGAVAGAASLGG